MTRAAILGFTLLAGLGAGVDDGSPTPILDEYKARAAQTAPDAAAQLRLALWCERNGLAPERIKHLGRAMMADPADRAARGLLGLMADGGTWRRPEAVVDRLADEPARLAALAEYRSRRDQTLPVDKPETADAHAELARWCEANGLAAEAEAHYRSVVRLDPSREPVWKRLGYKRKDGRWTTDAQLAAERADAAAQRDADKFWLPRLQKLKGRLARSKERESAEAELSSIADPRAVPSVVRVFATGRAADQANAVQILGQIDAPSASRALATIAVLSDDAEVRRRAIETLRGRDAREFAGRLVAMVRKPLRYEVRPVGGPGEPGGLFVEGERYNVRRQYQVPALMPVLRDWSDWPGLSVNDPFAPSAAQRALSTALVARPGDAANVVREFAQSSGAQGPASAIGAPLRDGVLLGPGRYDSPSNYAPWLRGLDWATMGPRPPGLIDEYYDLRMNGYGPNQAAVTLANRQEAARATATMESRLQSDLMEIRSINESIERTNDRVLPVLQGTTGRDVSAEPGSWRAWWVDTLGLAYVPESQYKPTFDTFVRVRVSYVPAQSCFGAGTPVWTQSGPQAIESLKVGDLVLAQDTVTGELGYRPVAVVHHNPPNKTFVVRVEGEDIVSTPIHRFWAAGRGWVMARDLKAGDRLRNLGRTAVIESVDEGAEQPVYNLDVAGAHSFFVGEQGALVHDATLPDLVARRFDAAAEDE